METNGNDSNEIFVYTGQPRSEIPEDVTQVSVADSVQKIPDRAFQGCGTLVLVSIPKTVENIGDSAFSQCPRLKKVALHKGLKVIGCQAFSVCRSLVDIDLPDGLERIGARCFLMCVSLLDVSIPTTVEKIEEATFFACKSLVSVGLHNRINGIGGHAFVDCASLVEIDLHEGLKSIGYGAFSRCISLNAVAFPSSLELIASQAFCDCASLLGVEIPADTKGIKVGNDSFRGCKSLVTYSISDGSLQNFAGNHGIGGLELLHVDCTGTRTICRDRWSGFPIHDLCYHSSRTTVEELAAAIDSCESLEDSLEDAMGMTPFHIVATSSKPRVEIFQCLLDRYSLAALEYTDKFSHTMMDYLLKNRSSKVVLLIHLILETAIADQVSGWSPVWKDRFGLSGQEIRSMIRSDDDITERRKQVLQLLEHAGQCIRKEMISLLELSLWKMKMDSANMLGSVDDFSTRRERCRLQCGADIVVDNVFEYLFDRGKESKCSTALSVCPLCSLTSLAAE
ncbi:unnamed protein product [Cylindrotheca closterium]|uniref:Uncharacterized protein n=1 Tax=Cylindrotheca closterium TaxID=2856 RepID=A0AAD2CC25_9STRA|nr:unnamed protein product [Cylindrotheca closterium]